MLTGVVEFALHVEPDLAAEIGPASTKGKILGQILSAVGIDHAFEQRESVRVILQRIIRIVHAAIFQLRVSLAQFDQNLAPDHEKSSSGIAHLGKAAPCDDSAV